MGSKMRRVPPSPIVEAGSISGDLCFQATSPGDFHIGDSRGSRVRIARSADAKALAKILVRWALETAKVEERTSKFYERHEARGSLWVLKRRPSRRSGSA